MFLSRPCGAWKKPSRLTKAIVGRINWKNRLKFNNNTLGSAISILFTFRQPFSIAPQQRTLTFYKSFESSHCAVRGRREKLWKFHICALREVQTLHRQCRNFCLITDRGESFTSHTPATALKNREPGSDFALLKSNDAIRLVEATFRDFHRSSHADNTSSGKADFPEMFIHVFTIHEISLRSVEWQTAASFH